MAIEIKVNDTVVYTLNDLQLTILKTYVNEDRLSATINNWAMCSVRDQYNAIAAQFKNEWINRLQADSTVTSVPMAAQDFVDFVIARSDYKTQKQKDQEGI